MLCTTTRRRSSCSSFSLFLEIGVLLKLTTQLDIVWALGRWARVFLRFCQTFSLNIYRTDRHPVCRIGRTVAVHERSEVSFSIPQGTLPWQPVLWAKSTSNPHIWLDWVRVQSTRSLRAARSVLLTGLWVQLLHAAEAQANKLFDSMDAGESINWAFNNNLLAARGIIGWATSGFALHLFCIMFCCHR